VEAERERLAIILARLSSGVVVLDRQLTLRLANAAAGSILGADLAANADRLLADVATDDGWLRQFTDELRARFAAGREEWREQLELPGAAGKPPRVLACA
jgi:PAS domain-containing protein